MKELYSIQLGILIVFSFFFFFLYVRPCFLGLFLMHVNVQWDQTFSLLFFKRLAQGTRQSPSFILLLQQ